MRFLIDRCAGVRLARWLREQGHDVVESRERGADPGDRALLQLAADEDHILVTIDADFGQLVFAGDMPNCGLIRLPDVPAERRIALMADLLTKSPCRARRCARGGHSTLTSLRSRSSRWWRAPRPRTTAIPSSFSRALREHAGMVLRRLAGRTDNTAQDAFRKARTEPLITLGSAPLSELGFRSVVLGQLGESRLAAAIDTDIAGELSHARALDADSRGPLQLRTGSGLKIGIEFTVTVEAASAEHFAAELRQILQELGLAEAVRLE